MPEPIRTTEHLQKRVAETGREFQLRLEHLRTAEHDLRVAEEAHQAAWVVYRQRVEAAAAAASVTALTAFTRGPGWTEG